MDGKPLTKASEVAETIPEMEMLNSDKEEQITKLLEQVLEMYSGEYPPQFARCRSAEDLRILAYRYLVARKWSQEKALQCVKKVVTFREKQHMDGMPLFPCAFQIRGFDEADLQTRLGYEFPRPKPSTVDKYCDAMSQSHCYAIHMWDKSGHPLLFEILGHVRSKNLMDALNRVAVVGQKPKDVVMTFHLYVSEVLLKVIKYADMMSVARGKRRIVGATVIMDFGGLSSRVLTGSLLKLVREIIRTSSNYYPEMLHRLFVVNCPSSISVVYSLIRGTLHSRTRQKLTFCTPDCTLDVLSKVIDFDKIPREFGGRCSCEGGCLPKLATQENSSFDENEVSTELISVAARQKHRKTYELFAGEEVFWEFVCTNKHSVGFSVEFVPATNDGHVMNITELQPVYDGASHFVADMDGVLILTWDNSKSLATSKKLQMRVFKHVNDSGRDISFGVRSNGSMSGMSSTLMSQSMSHNSATLHRSLSPRPLSPQFSTRNMSISMKSRNDSMAERPPMTPVSVLSHPSRVSPRTTMTSQDSPTSARHNRNHNKRSAFLHCTAEDVERANAGADSHQGFSEDSTTLTSEASMLHIDEREEPRDHEFFPAQSSKEGDTEEGEERTTEADDSHQRSGWFNLGGGATKVATLYSWIMNGTTPPKEKESGSTE